MRLHENEIHALEAARVIDAETANRIRVYYRNKHKASPNRLFSIFAILGALLIGLGIILILAHNWDDFSKNVRAALAFAPILVGQALCTFTLLRRNDSAGWRESSATFLTIAIGASISLIAQIYNIAGDFNSFVFTWSALALPLVYLMRSSMTSLLYLCGITAYATSAGYGYPGFYPYWYLLLLAAVLPHYWLLVTKRFDSNFTAFHHWFLCGSMIISLGTFAKSHEEFHFVSYVNLFAIFYFIGHLEIFDAKKLFANAWLVIGSLGTVCTLIPLTFSWFWDQQVDRSITPGALQSPEFISAVLLGIVALWLFLRQRRRKPVSDVTPIEPVFILFYAAFLLGYMFSQTVVVINAMVFFIGLLTIRRGAQQDHLGVLNYGLLIITVLVACRFFDTELSFVIRGLLFIGVGAGFILANSKLLRRRRENEK